MGSTPASRTIFYWRMAFKHFAKQTQGVELLQRSLARGRLGHAYLFAGDRLEELESLARTLAKTLNCQNPVKAGGVTTDCCDACLSCRKIDHDTHADVHWARPESKSLKPTEAEYKVAVIAGADRLNVQAANAFLKTLEEPPGQSVLILLSTEPQRILETILSRCLRLNFFGEGTRPPDPAQMEWLAHFDALAALTARSPLQQHHEIEKDLREKWEDELAAAIEAEYRRQRAEALLLVQWWLRDVWLSTLRSSTATEDGRTLAAGGSLLKFPEISGAAAVARRITPRQALENMQTLEQTQRLLHTNVQEALALEVSLLKLRF